MKIGGEVVFSSCRCLHWILQDSDEMWGWKPKAWGLQWFSTHCQSLTSCQLLGPPGGIRATGRTHRWVTEEGAMWQQISFSKKQNYFILFSLEIFSLNNDRRVRVWPGADDPVIVQNNWLYFSGSCWWWGRVVLTLGRWFLASPKLLLVNWMTGTPFPSYMDLTPMDLAPQHSLSEQGIS